MKSYYVGALSGGEEGLEIRRKQIWASLPFQFIGRSLNYSSSKQDEKNLKTFSAFACKNLSILPSTCLPFVIREDATKISKIWLKTRKEIWSEGFLMEVKEPSRVFSPIVNEWTTQFYCCWCEKLGQLSRWIMREFLNRNRRRRKKRKLLWLSDPFRRLCYAVPYTLLLCAALDALNSIGRTVAGLNNGCSAIKDTLAI